MAMARKKKILILCLLILLCAGLLAGGALQHFANGSPEQKDEAAKLAELEAALIKAASTGGAKRSQSGTIGQKRTSHTSRTRST